MAELQESKLDMLTQLEDAQRDLMRALQLLDEPVSTAGVSNGSTSYPMVSPSPVRTAPSPQTTSPPRSAASIASSLTESLDAAPEIAKPQFIEQLKDLRATIEEDQARAQAAIRERDMEIRRLQRRIEELTQHHYIPPLSVRYEPAPQRQESAYRGPLLLPEVKPEFTPQSWNQWSDIQHHDAQAEADLNRSIVCYMVDGSEKYTPMTLNAIQSLNEMSPGLNIGIITHDIDMARQLLSHIPAKFHFGLTSVHFAGWNATQFKLDILQFADIFDNVVWMDSDTFVYRDIRPMLLSFYRSKKPYALMPDLVMHDAGFHSRWPGNKQRVFVPQASLMMFKSGHIRELFARWEDRWREWIFPVPFAKFNDPMLEFEGSAFCIEQYALGMALEDLLQDIGNDIYQLNREQVFLGMLDDETLDIYAVPFRFSQGIAGLSGVTSYGSARLLTLSMAAGMNTSARIFMQGSYAGSYATSSGGLVMGPLGYNMIDNVGQCVLHLYNTRYEVVYRLVHSHQAQITDKLKQITMQ